MKLKFLFVDDSDSDNRYTNTIIRIDQLPITPHFEYNGLEALEYLSTLRADFFPEVIVIDINMPLMNGFQFADQYKKHYLNLYPNTLLFITSSSNRMVDLARVQARPFIQNFLTKPFSSPEFVQKIIPHLQRIGLHTNFVLPSEVKLSKHIGSRPVR